MNQTLKRWWNLCNNEYGRVGAYVGQELPLPGPGMEAPPADPLEMRRFRTQMREQPEDR